MPPFIPLGLFGQKRRDKVMTVPVGDSRRRPTLDPVDQEAPSTCKVHHPVLLDSVPRIGG